jgi:glycosyltransferase involved in cell wall biosynthesis
MGSARLTVAWVSDFPVEWLPEVPEQLRGSPRRQPATWQMTLLGEFQKDPGLRLHVFLLRHRLERGFSFEWNGTNFHVLKAPPWLRLGSVFWVDTLLMRGRIRRLRPDLVHAWGMELGAPLIAHRLGRPYVMTVQGLFNWLKERVPLSSYYRFLARLERACLARAPVVTTESAFAVRYLQARYPALRLLQVEHAPNPVFFQVRRQPRLQPPHFVSVGTLSFLKGTDLLLQALERLRPELAFSVEIICRPNSRYLASRPRLASDALLQRIEFKHDLLPFEVARALERPLLLILPTRADVSPNAIKESVVAAVPVVASDIGGVPDHVKPGRNGLLCPAGDLEGLVSALRAALEHPLFGRGQVDAATLAQSRDYLSPTRMASNFRRAYQMALEASARAA